MAPDKALNITADIMSIALKVRSAIILAHVDLISISGRASTMLSTPAQVAGQRNHLKQQSHVWEVI